MTSPSNLLRGPVVAILNTGSGSCDASSASKAKEAFSNAGLRDAEVVSVDPPGLVAALDAAIAKAAVLVVLGGDGTIGTAATRCGETGPLLIPLPGGTMNMLPKSLYGTGSWTDALAATLTAPRVQTVSGGELGGKRFYCAAIVGAPSLWADAREAVRERQLLGAVKKAVTAARRSLSEAVEYDFGDTSGSAEAVSIICPLVSEALENHERALEAVALDPTTAAALFGLAFHAAYDGWRNDPSVTCVKTRKVVVTGQGALPTILDGEKAHVGRRAEVRFVPIAFRALVPAQLGSE